MCVVKTLIRMIFVSTFLLKMDFRTLNYDNNFEHFAVF